jgi:alpha-D-ribose 1-methylphosphonate 5-triphosphate diphosphatase
VQTLIYNAMLILPDRVVEPGWLLIEQEHIRQLGSGYPSFEQNNITAIDAHGDFLLPGLIDLHCDAIEKLVEPRPGVHIDVHTAIGEADWRLAGSGITTEFHAVSLDDGEFGVRSDSFASELYQALQGGSARLIRHKLHVRLELSSQKVSQILHEMIIRGEADMVSLMDHSPGQGQFRSLEAYREYVARTTSRSYAEIDILIAEKRTQTTIISQNIAKLTRLAREAGLVIATHDDDTAAKVEQWPALGIRISEFPTTLEAASRAHQLGMTVCMGAPNVLRGRSSGGNLSATEAIQEGVVDALCSDYYPASMLSAVFLLTTRKILSLPQAARLVTLNPAQAIGLDNQLGSLEVGKVADIIQVRLNQQGIPAIQRLFVGGRERVHAS